MLDKPNALRAVGLHREGSAFKAAVLSFKKGAPALDDLCSVAMDDHVNPLYTGASEQKIEALIKTELVVTSLSAHETLVRPLEVKLVKEKAIDAIIAFQAEPLLPYSIENAVIDWIKLSQDKEGSHLSVIATRKDYLFLHLEGWKKCNIDPEVVSTTPIALAAFSGHFCSEGVNPYFVVHLGIEEGVLALVQAGKLIAAQNISRGISELILFYQEEVVDVDGIDLFQAKGIDKASFPKLYMAFEGLRIEIMKTLFSFSKQLKSGDVNGLFITGEVGGGAVWIADHLCAALGQPRLLPMERAQFPISLDKLLSYAVPIGLALTVLPKAIIEINFRQQEFAYPNMWRHLRKPLSLYFCVCLLLAGGIHYFGEVYLGYKLDSLKQSYGELLAEVNKPYNTFEVEYEEKHPFHEPLQEGEVPAVEVLTIDDLYDRVEFLEHQIESAPDTIALLPNTPRVSDVLAWLMSHPNVSFKDEETNVTKPLIQVDSFNYTLVSRPEEKKRGNRYQAKVEIEFTSMTPKLAREFHDALIAPNDFVDPKAEVKWSTNRGKYRTSFFLKDKTVYPAPSKGAGGNYE